MGEWTVISEIHSIMHDDDDDDHDDDDDDAILRYQTKVLMNHSDFTPQKFMFTHQQPSTMTTSSHSTLLMMAGATFC